MENETSLKAPRIDHPSFVRICERHGLNALIGKPAKCIWETSITGYDVTLWSWSGAYETYVAEMSVFVPGKKDAERVAARWTKANA